jgi:exonuclease SbcD
MIRLLHTSDWHLGRKLYDRSRLPEQQAFLDWLLEEIKQNQVDLVLLAGDVFDSSVPSAQSTDAYYRFLFRLYQETSATAIIIAGNHDSAVRLAAPRQFLKIARIHLVGNLNPDNDDCRIFYEKGAEKIAVVALPYLPEGEILSHVSFEEEIASARRYREAIRKIYENASAGITCPLVVMGHLFLDGATSTDSERTIQLGGSLPVTLDDLPPNTRYAALGHLHRPQKFEKNGILAVYSGSPLPMTFKEAEYAKKLFLIDIAADQSVTLHEKIIPVFRPLVRVHGTFEEIMNAAAQQDWEKHFIEIELQIDQPEIGMSDQIRGAFAERGGEVASVQTVLRNQNDEHELTADEVTSQSPQDIFGKFYRDRFGEPGDAKAEQVFEGYQTSFNELIELWRNQEVEGAE